MVRSSNAADEGRAFSTALFTPVTKFSTSRRKTQGKQRKTQESAHFSIASPAVSLPSLQCFQASSPQTPQWPTRDRADRALPRSHQAARLHLHSARKLRDGFTRVDLETPVLNDDGMVMVCCFWSNGNDRTLMITLMILIHTYSLYFTMILRHHRFKSRTYWRPGLQIQVMRCLLNHHWLTIHQP